MRSFLLLVWLILCTREICYGNTISIPLVTTDGIPYLVRMQLAERFDEQMNRLCTRLGMDCQRMIDQMNAVMDFDAKCFKIPQHQRLDVFPGWFVSFQWHHATLEEITFKICSYLAIHVNRQHSIDNSNCFQPILKELTETLSQIEQWKPCAGVEEKLSLATFQVTLQNGQQKELKLYQKDDTDQRITSFCTRYFVSLVHCSRIRAYIRSMLPSEKPFVKLTRIDRSKKKKPEEKCDLILPLLYPCLLDSEPKNNNTCRIRIYEGQCNRTEEIDLEKERKKILWFSEQVGLVLLAIAVISVTISRLLALRGKSSRTIKLIEEAWRRYTEPDRFERKRVAVRWVQRQCRMKRKAFLEWKQVVIEAKKISSYKVDLSMNDQLENTMIISALPSMANVLKRNQCTVLPRPVSNLDELEQTMMVQSFPCLARIK